MNDENEYTELQGDDAALSLMESMQKAQGKRGDGSELFAKSREAKATPIQTKAAPAESPPVKDETPSAPGQVASKIEQTLNRLAGCDPAPVKPEVCGCPFVLQKIAADKAFTMALKEATDEVAELKALKERLDEILYPEWYAEKLTAEIGKTTDAAGLVILRDKLAALQTRGSKTVQEHAKRQVAIAYRQYAKKLLALFDSADGVIDKLLAEIVEAEEAFHAGYGVPRQPTAVYRTVEGVKRKVREMRAIVKRNAEGQFVFPSNMLHVFAFFGG